MGKGKKGKDKIMDYQKLLYKYIKSHKITIKKLSDLTGIKYELLRRSLKETRILPTNEFVEILKKLGIGIEELEKRE